MGAIIATFGALMVATAVFGDPKSLEQRLAEDIAPGSQLYAWIGSLGALAALGFYPPLRDLSRSMVGLVLVGVIVGRSDEVLSLLRDGPQIEAEPNTEGSAQNE